MGKVVVESQSFFVLRTVRLVGGEAITLVVDSSLVRTRRYCFVVFGQGRQAKTVLVCDGVGRQEEAVAWWCLVVFGWSR